MTNGGHAKPWKTLKFNDLFETVNNVRSPTKLTVDDVDNNNIKIDILRLGRYVTGLYPLFLSVSRREELGKTPRIYDVFLPLGVDMQGDNATGHFPKTASPFHEFNINGAREVLCSRYGLAIHRDITDTKIVHQSQDRPPLGNATMVCCELFVKAGDQSSFDETFDDKELFQLVASGVSKREYQIRCSSILASRGRAHVVSLFFHRTERDGFFLDGRQLLWTQILVHWEPNGSVGLTGHMALEARTLLCSGRIPQASLKLSNGV